MTRHWRSHHRHETAELNITAFMNLMVILVPFLLMTAVFSQVAILELNLPSSTDQLDTEPETMQLEVTVRDDRLEVGERNAGLLTGFPKTDAGYDLLALGEYLKQVKARFPDKLDATIRTRCSCRSWTWFGSTRLKATANPSRLSFSRRFRLAMLQFWRGRDSS
jgi:hypothetical protein